MKFRYVPLPTRRPIYPLGGAGVRFRPLVPIRVTGPSGFRTLDANLDSGSDDTVLPAYLAGPLGIDLSNAPEGEARAIGGMPVSYRYSQVLIRLTDGFEECEWSAIVGFVDSPVRWAVLGLAGMLQFFDVQFLGDRHEVILKPNRSFPGRFTVHRPYS